MKIYGNKPPEGRTLLPMPRKLQKPMQRPAVELSKRYSRSIRSKSQARARR